MSRKLASLSTGQFRCPVSAILHFQSQRLTKVSLEPAPLFQLFFEGTCPDEDAAVNWFEAFLKGVHLPFPLELEQNCGPFSSRVLKALGQIPFAAVKSYGEIAKELNNPKGARAVGSACNRNPYPLIIPCHRVVMSNGKMGGFAYGLSVKQDLLEFEKKAHTETTPRL